MASGVRIAQVLLLAFFGHLVAIAAYDLIIQGSTDYKNKPTFFYDIGRIVIGACILALTAYSAALIVARKYKLLFSSAAALTGISTAYVVIHAIYLGLNFSQLPSYVKYTLIVKVSIKTVVMIIGTGLTYYVAAASDHRLPMRAV